MFALGRDSLVFNTTLYVERVTPIQCVTTSKPEKAKVFNTFEEAEAFAKSNNLPLYDDNDENSNTVEDFAICVI